VEQRERSSVSVRLLEITVLNPPVVQIRSTNAKSRVLLQSRTLIVCSAIFICQLITAIVDGSWNRYVRGWTLELATEVRMVSVRYRPLLLVINVTKPSIPSFYDYYS